MIIAAFNNWNGIYILLKTKVKNKLSKKKKNMKNYEIFK